MFRDVLAETAEDAGPVRPAGPGFLAAGNQAIGRMLGLIGEVGQGLLGSELRGSVGAGGVNLPGDVMVVARLLGMPDDLNAAILRFQKDVMGWPTPDGRVDPGGRTFTALQHHQAAAPAPAAAPVADHPATGVELWPSILPTAKRGATTELTSEQKTLVDQLKANRDALPEYAIKKAGTSGMVLGDSGAGEKLTPTELKGDATDPATRAKKVAYKELGHEGTVDAINTYDDQILTWGKGFSALSGSMNEVLMIMFQADPEARHELLRAGIDCDAKSWRVVNTETGLIETGVSALRLMQFDTKLLGVFVTLGRAPQHQQHALDAQWAAMEKHAAHVPEYAYQWPDSAIALCAHLAHWAPAFGWGTHPDRYKGTSGDLVQIAGVFTRLASVNHKWATKLQNGAVVGPFDIMHPGHRLYAFADGAGATAVESAAEIITGTRAEIGDDDQYAGHVLFPVWGKKNTFYDIGSAGS
ncbi:hypothetical protein [Actinocrispum wychmicini]|uniref:hypothetical protein n=1 Tax=Actinocrispum wychmicini TaxID=1213861 RepID=UPI00104C237C|nr:hypothetical protein [Actinocrispum wychmicini]